MARSYDDPWTETLRGKWQEGMERGQQLCHYGCGRPAVMTEPGRPWKAHKVCAQGNPSTGPLDEWDGEEHKLATGGSFGCGDPSPTDAISCGRLGTKLSCQLCPNSPTYWKGQA
jgi:hypothetical protein